MKKLINWSDAYSIGYDAIDKQHEKLVELINKLYDAFLSATAHDIINDILDSMIEYTEYHFKFEEDLFRKFGYPQHEEHAAIHGLFVAKTLDFKQKLTEGTTTVTYDIMYFLRDWLIEHIQGEDVKYVDFFKENGVFDND